MTSKRYEGLFILNTAAKEESVKDIIDKLTADLGAAGGKVETVQKMDKRNFTRIADKKHTAGYFVNIIFEIAPAEIRNLQHRFEFDENVFRVMFTEASPTPAEAPAAAGAR